MDLLSPYVGSFTSAKNARSDLDIEQILAGCDEVEKEAENLIKFSKNVNSAGSSITPEVLRIDDVTVDKNLTECCDGIVSVKKNIIDTVSQIRSAAIAAYNEIQEQYNAEAIERDRQLRREHQENNS